MKTAALLLMTLLVVATAASAYVQPGHLLQPKDPSTRHGETRLGTPIPDLLAPEDTRGPSRARYPDPNQSAGPTNPVPEPGTMVLASMGLIALGTALRKRLH